MAATSALQWSLSMTDQLTLEKLESLLFVLFFFGFIVGLFVGSIR
jgi:hypothetical protein